MGYTEEQVRQLQQNVLNNSKKKVNTSPKANDKENKGIKTPKGKKQHPEYDLQVKVCEYLRNFHPNILFMSDTVANLRLTLPQQMRNKKIQKSDFHCPDLIIFKPNEKYHGLFIELKTESPWKKDGFIKASQNDHLAKQLETIMDLNNLKFYACFSWDFNDCIEKINDYLNNIL